MKLIWSRLATTDLAALRRYSIERWGRTVTTRYESDVRDAAKAAAQRPDRLRRLRGRLRLARVRSHFLIAEVDTDADRLTIARVLHVAMDIERHLPPE